MSQDVLTDLLGLSSPAIAIAFTDSASAGSWECPAADAADRSGATCRSRRCWARDDNEAYVAIPGAHLGAIVDSLRTITKLVYTLFFDNSMLPDAPARDRDIAQKTTMFTTALKNMKTLAEGGKLPPRGTTKPGGH